MTPRKAAGSYAAARAAAASAADRPGRLVQQRRHRGDQRPRRPPRRASTCGQDRRHRAATGVHRPGGRAAPPRRAAARSPRRTRAAAAATTRRTPRRGRRPARRPRGTSRRRAGRRRPARTRTAASARTGRSDHPQPDVRAGGGPQPGHRLDAARPGSSPARWPRPSARPCGPGTAARAALPPGCAHVTTRTSARGAIRRSTRGGVLGQRQHPVGRADAARHQQPEVRREPAGRRGPGRSNGMTSCTTSRCLRARPRQTDVARRDEQVDVRHGPRRLPEVPARVAAAR